MTDIVFEASTFNNMQAAGFAPVLLIGYYLDIGSINCDLWGEERRKVLINLEQGTDYVDSFFEKQRAAVEQLYRAAKSGETFRIWKSNEPNNLCAFAFVCNLLIDIDCKILIVQSPEKINCWGLIYREQYELYSPSASLLTKTEKENYSNLWIKLKNENALLRGVVDNQLTSVKEDFYDDFIKEHWPEGEFQFELLLGRIFRESNWSTHIGLLKSRADILKHNL